MRFLLEDKYIDLNSTYDEIDSWIKTRYNLTKKPIEGWSPAGLITKDGYYVNIPKGQLHIDVLHLLIKDGLISQEDEGPMEINRYNLHNTDLFTNMGYIRVNNDLWNYRYIQLPKNRPTNAQYETLTTWLDLLTQNKSARSAGLDVSINGGPAKWYSYIEDTDSIIKNIKSYYTTGYLYENLNITTYRAYHGSNSNKKKIKINKEINESKINSTPVLIPNKEDNIELYNKLDLSTFKSNIRCIRDNCGQIAWDLYDYLKRKGYEPKVIRGEFKTDNLNLLDRHDLTKEEQLLYKALYSDKFTNEMIIEFINDQIPDLIDDFYYIPHTWIELDGLILDPSYRMFNKGLDKPITKHNYIERRNDNLSNSW